MKTIRYLFCGALLLLTGSFSLNAQVNIVPNGNFEQASTDGNIPSWGNEYNADYNGLIWVGAGSNSINDAVFKEGKQSGYIAGKFAMNWIKGIPGNKTYDISFWFRSNAPAGVTPTVSMQGSNFAYFTGGGLSDADLTKLNTPHDAVVGEWVFVEIKGIKIPETTDDLIIGIVSNYDGFWIDDVKMVESTGTQSPQTITFADITKEFGDADFTLSATASSYLPVSYTIADPSIATITNGKVHILKIGSTTITASQGGDGAYEAAPNKTVALTVTAPPVGTAEVPNGNFEQVDADGNIASWGINYNGTMEGTVSADKAVFKEGKQSGYIANFRTAANLIKNFPGNKTYDISFWYRSNAPTGVTPRISLTGTYWSGGSFDQDVNTILDTSPENIVSGEWLFVEKKGIRFPDGYGSLNLHFQGNNDYGFWLDDVRIVESGTITKTAQTITFTDITKKTGDADFALSATASSNLPVSYSIADASIATITNGTVHILKAGTTTITASQAGNNTYNAATNVTVNLTVSAKTAQTITGLTDITAKVGDADLTLAATASSKLPVTYSIKDNSIATLTNGVLHFLKAGTTTITASQAGDATTYTPAPDVTINLTVSAKTAQTITGLTDIIAKTGDADLTLAAAASSKLAVTYSIKDNSIATLTNGVLHFLKTGVTTITASQVGDATYAAAPDVTVNLTVGDKNKTPQTISGLTDITAKAGDADFTLVAVASSKLAVTYSIKDNSIATVSSDGKVHILKEGATTITASQAGDATYDAAPDVTVNFTVAINYSWLLAPTITVEGTNFKVVGTDADKFTLFYIDDQAATATAGVVSLASKTGDLSLKATTADGTGFIKLKATMTTKTGVKDGVEVIKLDTNNKQSVVSNK